MEQSDQSHPIEEQQWPERLNEGTASSRCFRREIRLIVPGVLPCVCFRSPPLVEFRHPNAGLRILKPDGEPPCGYGNPAACPGTRLISMEMLHGKWFSHRPVTGQGHTLRPNTARPVPRREKVQHISGLRPAQARDRVQSVQGNPVSTGLRRFSV
jgi:hypothetical protein